MSAEVIDFRSRGSSAVVAPAGVSPQALEFLDKARSLLALSHQVEEGEGFEYAFQAALRCAGALIADADASRQQVGKKSRRPRRAGSAWVQLRKVAPEFASWADVFEELSPLRNDLRLGLVGVVSVVTVEKIQDLASVFLQEVEDWLGVLPAVA